MSDTATDIKRGIGTRALLCAIVLAGVFFGGRALETTKVTASPSVELIKKAVTTTTSTTTGHLAPPKCGTCRSPSP